MSSVSYYNNLYNTLSKMYGSGSNSWLNQANSSSKKNSSLNSISNLQGLAAEYKQIKTGSYKKLLTKYYENGGTENGGGTIYDEMTNLRTVSGNASQLKSTVSSMKRADFKNDVEGTLQQAKNFVDSYNSVIDNSVKVDRKGVLRDTLSLVNTTKATAGLLSEVGITVGTDNKLTLDEEKWKNAYSTTKQTLFGGTSSYASQVMYKASQVASGAAAGTGLSTKSPFYTNTGNYTKNNTASSLFDYMF